MNQEDITQIYETLAPMAGDYMNAQAEQIGQAQRSMGPLAANVQGSTTSGLGNYTYNRLMRPQVDVMRDEIRVQGYANQLNRLLSDALNNARNRYNRRGGGGGGDTDPDTTKPGNNTGVTTIGGVDDEESGGGATFDENIPQVFIPNKFLYEKEDGYMQQVARPADMSNRKWYDIYMKAKEQADRKGRKFINGK